MSDTPRTDAVADESDRITYPLRMHKLAEDLERELAAAKEEIERLKNEIAEFNRAEMERATDEAHMDIVSSECRRAQEAAFELIEERDSLRASLAELRKVADDLALLVTSLTLHEMQYRPEVQALAAWKERNPA